LSSQSEYEIHCAIVAYLDVALPANSVLHHSPNEGKHHIGYRIKQRRLGMRPGWPDIEVIIPKKYWDYEKPWGPVFFEIKNEKGRLSKNQKEVIDEIEKAGGHCRVARSIDNVSDYLHEFLGQSYA